MYNGAFSEARSTQYSKRHMLKCMMLLAASATPSRTQATLGPDPTDEEVGVQGSGSLALNP